VTSKVSHSLCRLPSGLSKRDHTIRGAVCCRRVATDKRSHAWIRKTHSTHANFGRNRGKPVLGLTQSGCTRVVADSAHSWKRTVKRAEEIVKIAGVPGTCLPENGPEQAISPRTCGGDAAAAIAAPKRRKRGEEGISAGRKAADRRASRLQALQTLAPAIQVERTCRSADR
jgi:hypothetical protein